MEEFVLIVMMFFSFFIGAILGNDLSDQELINRFKNPTCVESTVGKEVVKKCYEIKEVK